MNAHSHWVGVASKDRVDSAVAGGFAQLNHGKAAPLARLRAGDGFVFYSPRTAYPNGEPLQAFTAIGRVRTGTVYQQTLSAEFRPFRVDVDYLLSLPAPIKPLIAQLSFIRSKTHWGAAFRFGMLRIPEVDFALIAAAMRCELAIAQPQDSLLAAVR
jgi:EVE domain-containing protein